MFFSNLCRLTVVALALSPTVYTLAIDTSSNSNSNGSLSLSTRHLDSDDNHLHGPFCDVPVGMRIIPDIAVPTEAIKYLHKIGDQNCGIAPGLVEERISCSWDVGVFLVRKKGVDVSILFSLLNVVIVVNVNLFFRGGVFLGWPFGVVSLSPGQRMLTRGFSCSRSILKFLVNADGMPIWFRTSGMHAMQKTMAGIFVEHGTRGRITILQSNGATVSVIIRDSVGNIVEAMCDQKLCLKKAGWYSWLLS